MVSPSAFPNWSPSSLLASAEKWRLDLTVDHPALLARVARLSDDGLSWQDYLHAPDLIDLEPLHSHLSRLLQEEYGIALLHVWEDMRDDAMRLLLLLMGRAMGRNVTPSVAAESRPLFAVTATDDPTLGGEYVGNARHSGSLALHTDGSGSHTGRVDILGMLCIRAAGTGGISRFADARTVYLQLEDHARTLLSTPLPRVDPYNTHLPTDRLICRPVFDHAPERCFSYHPDFVRDGIRLRDCGAIAPPLEAALSSLDTALEQSAVEVLLDRGDIVLVNNGVVAHGRTAFDDHVQSRLIERLWVETWCV